MRKVDPDAQAVLDMTAGAAPPDWSDISPDEIRQGLVALRELLWPDIRPVAIRDVTAAGRHGRIPLRVYRPEDVAADVALPCLIFMHGGGWVACDLESHDAMCAELAGEAGISVIAVDYRLSPEHKFPEPLDDCMDATDWIVANAKDLAISADRVAVGGDSAGGNLATVVALQCRSTGKITLRAQLLVYPVTDATMSSDSYRRNGEGYFLTGGMMKWFVDQYLRAEDKADDWRISPIFAENLDNAAPAYVVTCGLDPLCDEGMDYAERLRKANVPVLHAHYPDQPHGFLSWAKVIRSAAPALRDIADFLREKLA